MGLTLTDKAIDKYFRFLSFLDNDSKKRLILKLENSINSKYKKHLSLKNLRGKWVDSRDSDEIIKDIRNSRVDKKQITI